MVAKEFADRDHKRMVDAVRVWVENHMDQWEKFKFESSHGTIYVTVSMQDPHPDSFEEVDGG